MIGNGIPNPLMLAGGDPLDELGKIDRSLRFRRSATPGIYRTATSTSSRTTWTYSAWVKLSAILPSGIHGIFVNNGDSGTYRDLLEIQFGQLRFDVNSLGASWVGQIKSNALFRDCAQHAHIVAVYDSTNATGADRMRLYVNGARITSFAAQTIPAQNSPSWTNLTGVIHRMGLDMFAGSTEPLDGYLSHVAFVDGQALDPSSFGLTHPRTGQWRPKNKSAVKAVVDAGGVNSFFLLFDDPTNTTTLCADASSKGNHWTAANISLTAGVTYDSSLDTPTNNFTTLDPNFAANGFSVGTISDGGLKFSSSTTYHFTPCTVQLPNYGKWQAEFIPQDTVSIIGLADLDNGSGSSSNIGSGYGWYSNAIKTGADVTVQSGLATQAANDKITVCADMDALSMKIYKNNTLVCTQALTAGKRYAFACGDYYSGGATSCYANFGQQTITYPQAGYQTLCTKNLKYDSTQTVTVSGTFIGNAAADGTSVIIGGCPETLTINGNAVTFGTHADRLANGFKLRTSSASYNAGGANTWSATILSPSIKSLYRFQNAKGN